MTQDFRQGEYVYVPASSLLYQFGPNTCDFFVKSHQTSEPIYLMFLQENCLNPAYYDVFYEGKIWSIDKENVYEGKLNER